MSTASRSAADMLEVGWPDPALVEERIESIRNCAASSAAASRPMVAGSVVVIRRRLPSLGVPSALRPLPAQDRPTHARAHRVEPDGSGGGWQRLFGLQSAGRQDVAEPPYLCKASCPPCP